MEDKAKHVRTYTRPEYIVSSQNLNDLIDISRNIFCELGLRDYARLDFRILNNTIYFLEANVLPVFSRTSEIGEISRLYNLNYEDICTRLINTVYTRLMA